MKRFLIIAIMLCITSSFIGCSKPISTEYENVEVKIVDKYYKASYTLPMRVGKVTTMRHQPAVYKITVEYNGAKYTMHDYDTYDRYKDKVGQTTTGTLVIRTYKNGTVIQCISELK